MTTLEKKLNDECLQARKEKDSLKANLLLTIKGQVQNAQKGPNASSMDEVINAAAKSIIKGLETVTQTEDTKREKMIAEEYLPQFMKEWEVIDYVSKMEFSSDQLGACIGQANKELAGKADGKIISLVVKNLFSKKIISTPEDAEIFLNALENPPVANDKLKRAQQNHSGKYLKN